MTENNNLLSAIADLYYNQGLTQAEIAVRFGISRPKVSRKLAEAKDKGIVKIFIDSASDDISEIENQIFNTFNLKGVKVASVPKNDVELSLKIVAQLGATYFHKFLAPGDRIGINWGWTLYELSKCLPSMDYSDTSIVQLTGGVDNAKCHSFAQQIITNTARALNARSAFFLPCPALVESPIILDILLHDAKINGILEQGRACNKIFVNIALPDESSCLYQAGYLSKKDLTDLEEAGAVGSICSHFYNAEGQICSPALDARTVGIPYADIQGAECVFACIVGHKKANALYCALKAGLVDVLVTDYYTAVGVLEKSREEE